MNIGHESNRIITVVNAKQTTAEIGGKQYFFRSRFEYHWALYLQFLKDAGEIKSWAYEVKKFDFWKFGYRNKPYEYTPDFLIVDKDGDLFFQETKGYLQSKDISKYVRLAKHYPDVQLEVVLQRIPKRGKGFEAYAKLKSRCKIVRRIIDAKEIFKQVKGIIK